MDTTRQDRPRTLAAPERRGYARVLQRVAFAVALRPTLYAITRLTVKGRENLPESGPYLIVSNHVSHIDTVSLLALFHGPRLADVRPVAAEDYWDRHPLLLWTGHTFFNILPIVRERPRRADDPIARMVRALDQGAILIMFPEGTRGTGVGTKPFKPGVAHLIEAMPGLTVVPAWMENTGRCMPTGAILPRPARCEIRLGRPLRPEGSREEILRALERAVRALGAAPADC